MFFCLYRGGCDFTRVSGCVSNGYVMNRETVVLKSRNCSLTGQSESVPAFLGVLAGIKRTGNMFTT